MSYENARYIVVGFCVNVENSVCYFKCNGIKKCLENIHNAFTKAGADFVSVRRIR